MRDPNCTKCPLHAFAKTVCMSGTGPETADIMLVGEAPGEQEDSSGVPFVGAAGQVLNRALSQAGLVRSEVFITNTNRCRPPQNRTPTDAETDQCLSYLLEEIERVQPKAIVLLGASAMKAITGKKGITAERGKPLTPRKGLHFDARLTATFHPASTLYGERQGKENEAKIVEDLRAARIFVEGVQQSPGEVVRIHPPGSTDAEIIDSLRLFGDAQVFTCDLEWTAGRSVKDMIWPWSRRGEPFTISFTARTSSGLVSVALAFPLSATVKAVVAKLLQNRKIVMHNASADTLWTYSQGLRVALAGDTMLWAYLLDETQPRNLEDVSAKYGGMEGGWKGHTFQQRPATDEQWREILIYNATDTKATLLAWEGIVSAVKAQPKERKDAILRLNNELMLPTVPILRHAAEVGVPINQERLKIELQRATARKFAYGEELAEITGLPPVKAIQMATSPDATKAYLKSMGIDVESTDDDTLVQYEAYPAVSKIRKVRKEQKRISTYFEPWDRLLERQRDGRLHTLYKQTGTGTGRMSTEGEGGGTVHQTPRNDEEVQFRELVEAPPGRRLVIGDYSTIEMKFVAWRADEQTMLPLFQNIGTLTRRTKDNGSVILERVGAADLHKTTAAFVKRLRVGPISLFEFMKIREEFEAQVTKVERQDAKGVNFGFAFGMMEKKFQTYALAQYGISFTLEECAFARRAYMMLYPGLPIWHEREMRDASRLGYTETVFGRRRSFNPDDTHAAINTPIQSSASDLTNLAMIQVDMAVKREGLDADLILFVHDSIGFEASEQDAPRLLELLHYHMENVDTSAFGFKLPFLPTAEVKMSKTWAA